MLHCPKCDQLVNRHCKFCPHCGLPLADDAADDATLMGSAPAALPTTPMAMARQRGLLLYGGIAAGCLALIIGIVLLTAGHSKQTGAPSALRPGTARDALYGRAAIVNPSGVGGSLMGGSSRQVTPLGAPVLAQPMHGESFAAPSAPTLLARNSFGPGDLLAPPVTLYHPVYFDEEPPLSPVAQPQAAPAPGPVASAPIGNISGEPEQPAMSPFAPVAPAAPSGPAASEEAPAPENPPAAQPPAPAAAAPPSGPTYINGGYGPAVGNYGYGGYPAFGGHGANGLGGYGGYGTYGSPGFQNYANLPYGYPVLGPLGGYIPR